MEFNSGIILQLVCLFKWAFNWHGHDKN